MNRQCLGVEFWLPDVVCTDTRFTDCSDQPIYFVECIAQKSPFLQRLIGHDLPAWAFRHRFPLALFGQLHMRSQLDIGYRA